MADFGLFVILVELKEKVNTGSAGSKKKNMQSSKYLSTFITLIVYINYM